MNKNFFLFASLCLFVLFGLGTTAFLDTPVYIIKHDANVWDINVMARCTGSFGLAANGSCYSFGSGAGGSSYSGLFPVIVDNDANTIGLSSDFNSQYCSVSDFNSLSQIATTDINAIKKCGDVNSVLTGKGLCQSLQGFHSSGNNSDANKAGVFDYNVIANPPWITSYTDTNAQTACDDNSVLRGDGVCVPYTVSQTFLPSRILTVYGTDTNNNVLNAIKYYDNNAYTVREIAGSNPMRIDINFTGISSFDSVSARLKYDDGAASHYLALEIWDFTINDWEFYASYQDQEVFNVVNVPVFDSTDHVSSDGNVNIRFLHGGGSGQTSHFLYIDFLWLQKGTTSLVNSSHDSLSDRNSPTNHPWAMPKTDVNSNFVPYQKAINDLNMGDKNISTSGLLVKFGNAIPAETVSLTTNMANMSNSDVVNYYAGLKFVVNNSGANLSKITKHSACTGNTAYLLASDKNTVLDSVPFVGNEATFYYKLTSGTTYYAAVKNADNSNYDERYSLQASWGGESYPINGTNINLTATLYNGTDSNSNAVGLVSISTTENKITLEKGDLNISGNLTVQGIAQFVPFVNARADLNLFQKNLVANNGTFVSLTATSGGGSGGVANETATLTTNMANMAGSENGTYWNGLKFYTNVGGIKLTKITKHASCTADTAYLVASNGTTVLASAAFSGNEATFNYELTTGTNYYALAKKADDSSHDHRYSLQASWGGESYPINGTNVNLTATRYNNADYSTVAVAVVSVTTDLSTSLKKITLANGDVNISGNLYLSDGNSYAKNHIDWTPYFTGTTAQALNSLLLIKGANGDLNHNTLPDFAKVELKTYETIQDGETCDIIVDTKKCAINDYNSGLCSNTISVCKPKYQIKETIKEGRNIGAMITLQTEAIKELEKQIVDLNAQVILLKNELCKINQLSAICK